MTRTPTRRAPALRTLLTVGLPALAACAVLTGTGVLDLLHAVLLVVVVVTAVALWRRLDDGEEAPWPDVPQDRREGARNDVSELGWATFTRSGAVGDRVLRRVRALAAARLADRGVDLAAPDGPREAARILGTEVVEGLTSRRQVGRAEVHGWLDAIDALLPATTAPTSAPSAPHPAGRPQP
ncbi:hypothetical protein [Krasilnikoviella flava]|uniref:DUF4129 domain-containing protein n=1 Tax=Krasilnikoviella flava TaxID=526729 RepID=A0A1T5L4W2_9MICO|nr:hypothetical protein [Krasilnikoviella flava]SKC71087.1 hypothetical protein SAMN04324258_2878 [Krasilnikoviella flava]